MAMSQPPQPPQFRPRAPSLQTQGPRPRNNGRQLPTPAVHPDHQWAQPRQNNQASGNARGQRPGAASVQIQPQAQAQPQAGAVASAAENSFRAPTAPSSMTRPRSYSEAASGSAAARQTVRESLEQQAFLGAQVRSLENDPWRRQMEEAFGMSMTGLSGSLDSLLARSNQNLNQNSSSGNPPPAPRGSGA